MVPITGRITVSSEVLNYTTVDTKKLCLKKKEAYSWEVQLADYSDQDTRDPNRVLLDLFISTQQEQSNHWGTPNTFSRTIAFRHEGDTHGTSIDLPNSERNKELQILRAVKHYSDLKSLLSNASSEHLASRINQLIEGASSILGQRLREEGGEPRAQRQRLFNDPTALLGVLIGAVTAAFPANELGLMFGAPRSNPVTRNGLGPIPLPLMLILGSGRLNAILQECIFGSAISITVHKEKLKSDPLGVLHTLHEKMSGADRDSRLYVTFINDKGLEEEGDDFGGLGAQLITDLVRALVDHKDKLKGVEFDKESFPHLTSDEGTEVLTTLGYLMGLCFENDAYRTGSLFNELFYSTLQMIPPSFLIEYKALFLALNKNSKYFEELKEHANDYALDDPRVKAVICIAKGMEKFCDWGKVEQSENLQITIEGAFSKEILKEKLAIENVTIRRWLKQWIDASDEEMLKKFLYLATGTKTIGTEMIKWQGHAVVEQLPTFHTCTNTIDIPLYDSYETFKKKMDQAVTESDDSFLLA